MITEVNAASFQQQPGELLNQVESRNDTILIHRDGRPVAALVDAELFIRMRRMSERFDSISGQIVASYAAIPLERGLAEIDTLVAEERAS